jgi:hypothetical protein
MDTSEILVFSETQQAAVIGHALQHPKIFDTLDEFKIDGKWFVSNTLVDLYNQIATFKETFKRTPVSVDEIVDFVVDDMQKGAIKRTVEQCVNAKKRHPWDTLETKLVGWAKSRLIFVATKELVEKFNAGKHDDAYRLWQQGATGLQKIESFTGLEPDGFISSAQRVKGEGKRREIDAARTVPYAFTYLQDMTYGMLPTDIVLCGGTSGSGKTEWGRIQASYTAKTTQEPVHYFALEAEPDEIERRIKYNLLAQHYKADHQIIPRGMICYKNFRKNRLQEEFAPYESAVEAQFEKDYSTLNTYYRTRGDFGIDQLEREMWTLKGKSRLIVLDHIHFLDLGENETRELTYLIKQIRSMSQILEIPIILLAHITEKGIKTQELIPTRDLHYSYHDGTLSRSCIGRL